MKEVAEALLKLFGEKGEHWTQGTSRHKNNDGTFSYCLIGGISEIWSLDNWDDLNQFEKELIERIQTISGTKSIVDFNDNAADFSVIKKLIQEVAETA